jgi:hypothetical protein
MPRLNVQDFLTQFNSELHEHRGEMAIQLG